MFGFCTEKRNKVSRSYETAARIEEIGTFGWYHSTPMTILICTGHWIFFFCIFNG